MSRPLRRSRRSALALCAVLGLLAVRASLAFAEETPSEQFLSESAASSEATIPGTEGFPLGLRAEFEEGVSFRTADDEFELRLRLMEQTDFKYFAPRDQEPARPGVYIPRFRTYFEGHVSQSFEYELSLQRSVEGTFDVLDANVNFKPDEALQFRVGRFIVPYSYDWYDHLEQYFVTPERGLFPLNFGLSREAGAMLWGEPAGGQVQFALGGFVGQLAGLADTNTTRDAVAYLNLRPWLESGDDRLRNLNVGGSVAAGKQAFAEAPLPLRTSVQSSENDEAANAASSVFLEFEDDVVLDGSRDQAAVHLAWYGGGVSFESEAQVGRFRYAKADARTTLPVWGYHLTLGWFVTGEEVEGRTLVVPRRPFDPASGRWGPGAIEPFARFSHLALGSQVFDDGLADPDRWTRRTSMIDLGWNWHPNRYVKLSCDWQLSLYDSPVLLDPASGRRSRDNQLFWLRAQVFF